MAGSGKSGESGAHSPSTTLAEWLLVILIVSSLALEWVLHRIEKWVANRHIHLQAVLRDLYRELMVLGIVSFVFVMYELIKHPDSTTVASFEYAHLFIFLLAIVHTLVVLSTVSTSLSLSRKWKWMEQMELVKYLELKEEYRKLKDRIVSHESWWWQYIGWWVSTPRRLFRYRKLHEVMAFHDIRFQFLYYRDLPEDFNFSAYLRKIKALTFIELVETHWTLWVIFLTIVFADLLRRRFSEGRVVESWFAIGASGFLILCTVILAFKIRNVYWQLTRHPATYFNNITKDVLLQELKSSLNIEPSVVRISAPAPRGFIESRADTPELRISGTGSNADFDEGEIADDERTDLEGKPRKNGVKSPSPIDASDSANGGQNAGSTIPDLSTAPSTLSTGQSTASSSSAPSTNAVSSARPPARGDDRATGVQTPSLLVLANPGAARVGSSLSEGSTRLPGQRSVAPGTDVVGDTVLDMTAVEPSGRAMYGHDDGTGSVRTGVSSSGRETPRAGSIELSSGRQPSASPPPSVPASVRVSFESEARITNLVYNPEPELPQAAASRHSLDLAVNGHVRTQKGGSLGTSTPMGRRKRTRGRPDRLPEPRPATGEELSEVAARHSIDTRAALSRPRLVHDSRGQVQTLPPSPTSSAAPSMMPSPRRLSLDEATTAARRDGPSSGGLSRFGAPDRGTIPRPTGDRRSSLEVLPRAGTRGRTSLELAAALPVDELANRDAALYLGEADDTTRDNAGLVQYEGPALETGPTRRSIGRRSVGSDSGRKSTRTSLDWSTRNRDGQASPGQNRNDKTAQGMVNPSLAKYAEHSAIAREQQGHRKYPRWVVKLLPRLGRIATPAERLFWFGSHRFFFWCVEFVVFMSTLLLAIVLASFALLVRDDIDGQSVASSDIAAVVMAAVTMLYVLFQISYVMKKYTFVINNAGLVPEALALQMIHNVHRKRQLVYQMYADAHDDASDGENTVDESEAARERRRKFSRFFSSEAVSGNIPEIEADEANARKNLRKSKIRRRKQRRARVTDRQEPRSEYTPDGSPDGTPSSGASTGVLARNSEETLGL